MLWKLRSKHLNTEDDYGYVVSILHYNAFFLEYGNERNGGFEPLKKLNRRDVDSVLG